MRRVFSALVVVAVLAGAGFALYRAARPRSQALAYDLVKRLPFAARESDRVIILPGWPDAEPHLVSGFGGDAELRGRERFMWVRQGAVLKLDVEAPADRVLIFDIEAYQGIEDQRLVLSVNGKSLGSQEIPSARSRVRFDWPAGAQSASNEIALEFARAIVPADEPGGSGDTRDFAAALFSVTIGDGADRTLDLLRERETPRAFESVEREGIPSFTLPGGSRTSFAFRLPKSASLEFEANLHAWSIASGGNGVLRIGFDATDGRTRGNVDVPLSAVRTPTRLALKGDPGTPFVVRMEIVSDKPGLTFATIRAPRVLGEAEPPPVAALEMGASAKSVQALRPNVLFIVLDAARAMSFGAYGHDRGTTPNLDRFSRDGFTFDNAYTTAAYTNAAMSSVWTSQQPDRNHGNLSFSAKLPADRLRLAEVLTAQNIHTAGFVANAVAGTYNQFERGFKEFDEPFKKYGSQASGFRNVLPSFLDRMKKDATPFFAYLHYREPHEPYDPPAPFNTRFGPDAPIKKSERDGGERAQKWLKDINQGARMPSAEEIDHLRRLYDGNLAFADSEIGYLREEMESRGLLDNTVVIVTGDHGEALFEHGWIGHNAQVFEESAHVPLIISLPRALRAAYPPLRIEALVDHTDIAPTILDIFGLAGQGGSAASFQGHSLLRYLRDNHAVSDHREVLTRTIWDRPIYAVRNTSHTFVYNTATAESSLFDRSTAVKLEDAEHDFAPRAPIALRETYRQNLLAWIASLKGASNTKPDKPETMDPEVCENLKALGYLSPSVICRK